MRKMTMNTRRNRTSGFTLIEILIALTVLVIGLVGILALFPVGIKSSKSAVEDSTTSILAESIKSSIIQSFRLAPPQPAGGSTPIQYYHDGVASGVEFSLPAAAGTPTWVPLNSTGSMAGDFVFQVGADQNYPNDLPALAAADLEDADLDVNPYVQYFFKFSIDKVSAASVDNLYLIVMYIYRQYKTADAGGGAGWPNGDANEAVNVFSTMVASN